MLNFEMFGPGSDGPWCAINTEGEKAISFYRQAFEINPKKLLVPNLNHEYGFAYVQQGEIKKAQDVFQKMIDDTEDNSARGYRSMALLDMYCGKYGDAIQNLQKSSLINKIHGIGVSEFRDRLFMAIAYRAKGMNKEFINELQKAEELLKTEGLEPWWYFLAGKLYIREGNTKKAEAILVEISSRINDGNRKDQAVHDILLGEIEQIRGNNTRARELFESSFNLRNDAIALESLANHYFIHDDYEIAITKYQEIFKLNCLGWEAQEYWIRAHYRLANLYEQKGEKEQAINYYQALLKIWKDADEDIPELVAAKGHLANLID